MFEHFTERARKVMSLARQEAQRLNSEFIGTEHMLLAIFEEGGGVGCKALKDLAIDAKAVRKEIEKVVTPSTTPTVTLGSLPFSPRAKRAIELSAEEAHRIATHLGMDDPKTIGTGALLIGIYKESESIAHEVLKNLGVNLDRLRAEVDRLEGQAKTSKTGVEWTLHAVPEEAGRARLRLFRETTNRDKVPMLFVAGVGYVEAEVITLTGISAEKLKEVAAAIAEKHGAKVYIVEA